VTVDYCTYHYNHETRTAFLKIPHEVRLAIAKKLEDGVGTERILDDIYDSVKTPNQREIYINHQDIKRQFNIESSSRHSDDQTSVSLLVQEMKKLTNSPILFYKTQGKVQEEGMDNLAVDDFVLCIQTEFQLEMLKEFGKNTLCIDTTHGTNMYDSKLITLVVIDEFGEGVPVGWMLSNREDAAVIRVFFEVQSIRRMGCVF
jgi:hypothetical protein